MAVMSKRAVKATSKTKRPAKQAAKEKATASKPVAVKAARKKVAVKSAAPAKKAIAPKKPVKSAVKKPAVAKASAVKTAKITVKTGKSAVKKSATPAKISKKTQAKPAKAKDATKVAPKKSGAAKSKPAKKPVVKTAAKAAPTKKIATPVKLKPKSAKKTAAKSKADSPAKPATKRIPAAKVQTGPKTVKETAKPKSSGKENSQMITKTKMPTKGNSGSIQMPPTTLPKVKTGRKLRAEELNRLKKTLIQDRERIVDEMRILDDRSLTAHLEDEDARQRGFSQQLADSATDNIQVETDLAIRNIEAEQLAQIDDALRAIEAGNYGNCNRCHEAISFERLKAKPNARYCVSCLRLLEAGKA